MRLQIPDHPSTIFRDTDSKATFITIHLLQHTQYNFNQKQILLNMAKQMKRILILQLHIICPDCTIHLLNLSTYSIHNQLRNIPPNYPQFISKNFNFLTQYFDLSTN